MSHKDQVQEAVDAYGHACMTFAQTAGRSPRGDWKHDERRMDEAKSKLLGLLQTPVTPPQPDVPSTPAATWRTNGEPDPHGRGYDCERAALVLGRFTDDELANAAFMNYDQRPPLEDIVAGKAYSPIMYMTAVKDRIRWLSRALEAEVRKRDGWKLVPIVPTEAMQAAGGHSLVDGQRDRPEMSWAEEGVLAYTAMLAAAPEKP